MYFSVLLHVHRSCFFPEGVMSPEEDLTQCHEKVVAQVVLASSACPFLKSRFQTIFESILEFFLGNQLSILLFQESMLGTSSPVLSLVASKIGGECIEN